MTIKTTTHLSLARAASWLDHMPLPPALVIAVLVLMVAAGISAVNRLSAPRVAAVPTPALPIIIIASPLPVVPPTAVPQVQQVAAVVPENVTQRVIGVFGAPDPATYIGSVEAGRVFVPIARYGVEWTQVDMEGSGRVFVRTADLYNVPELVDLQPAPQPQVVYVSAPAPAYAVPTPELGAYAVTNADPPADFYAPPNTSLEERQKLIGTDPNALACGGSPLCGGMTNAQAQAALDAERAAQQEACSTERECNIQGRLANEHQP